MRIKIPAFLVAGALVTAALTGCVYEGGIHVDYDRLSNTDFSNAKVIKTDQLKLDGIEQLRLEGHPTRDSDGNEIDVVFQVNDSPDDQLHLTAKSNSKMLKADLPSIHKEGSTAIISSGTSQSDSIFANHNQKLAMQLTVQVPEPYQANIRAKINACIFQAERLSGKKIDIRLSAGRVKIGECKGEDTSLNVSAGSMTVGKCSGNGKYTVSAGKLNIDTLTGKDSDLAVSAGEFKVGSFEGNGKASVSAGHMELKKVMLTGNLNLDVSAGKLECGMPENSQFRFEGRVSGGSIDTFFQKDETGAAASKSYSANVNGGSDKTVDANVSAGKLDINKA